MLPRRLRDFAADKGLQIEFDPRHDVGLLRCLVRRNAVEFRIADLATDIDATMAEINRDYGMMCLWTTMQRRPPWRSHRRARAGGSAD